MSDSHADVVTEMARLTFTIDPTHRAEVEGHLTDLGLDVYVGAEGRFTAIWEEPDRDPGELIEELWGIHGDPFDVTFEEFARKSVLIFHPGDEPMGEADGHNLAVA